LPADNVAPLVITPSIRGWKLYVKSLSAMGSWLLAHSLAVTGEHLIIPAHQPESARRVLLEGSIPMVWLSAHSQLLVARPSRRGVTLTAYDQSRLQLLWQKDVEVEVGALVPGVWDFEAAETAQGRLLVRMTPLGAERLLVLEGATGKILWSRPVTHDDCLEGVFGEAVAIRTDTMLEVSAMTDGHKMWAADNCTLSGVVGNDPAVQCSADAGPVRMTVLDAASGKPNTAAWITEMDPDAPLNCAVSATGVAYCDAPLGRYRTSLRAINLSSGKALWTTPAVECSIAIGTTSAARIVPSDTGVLWCGCDGVIREYEARAGGLLGWLAVGDCEDFVVHGDVVAVPSVGVQPCPEDKQLLVIDRGELGSSPKSVRVSGRVVPEEGIRAKGPYRVLISGHAVQTDDKGRFFATVGVRGMLTVALAWNRALDRMLTSFGQDAFAGDLVFAPESQTDVTLWLSEDDG
jgi:hypothetical protein